jgi:hypothetical protein
MHTPPEARPSVGHRRTRAGATPQQVKGSTRAATAQTDPLWTCRRALL